MSAINHELGQYFTKDEGLQSKVFSFIKNNPKLILEPSVGRGDLVSCVLKHDQVLFDMYEIDDSIVMLDCVDGDRVRYGDFLKQEIETRYDTIIGNPPYVKTKSSNLYIQFIERCLKLLADDGEMIFIIPSDFFKLTSAKDIITSMLEQGTFTHIYHPHDEHLFTGATIDVIVIRYQKTRDLEHVCSYNDEQKYILNSNGVVSFHDELIARVPLSDYFDVYVGIVSGRDGVFKSDALGNIKVINGIDKIESFILIDKYPCADKRINDHMLANKEQLLARRIRKFTESNWFDWGALRNVSVMKDHKNKDCIYIHNLSRRDTIAFMGKIQYFGGNLLMLKPKDTSIDLGRIVEYLNSHEFKKNYTFSGRFKIGQRQLLNAQMETSLITSS